MTNLGIVIFISWATIGGLLIGSNRDLFSPAKMLHIYLLLFFLGVMFRDETFSIYLTYFVLLLASMFIGLYEAHSLKAMNLIFTQKRYLNFSDRRVKILFVLLWIGTLGPILAQLYMVVSFGGILSYLVAMGLRVKLFAGWGPVTAIIKLLFVINIIYFIILVFSKISSRKAILFFVFHTIITILVGILSGSRSLVLMNFFSMLVIYNYWGKPISLKATLSIGLILFGMGIFLGKVRSGGYSVSDTGVSLRVKSDDQNIKDKVSMSGTFNAGLEGVRLVYNQNVADKQYGQTFMVALTNLVPSTIWHEKPRSGGLVLTQDFTGNSWGGFSNLSTGIITESILNFGLGGGLIAGFFSLILMFIFFNNTYLQVRNRAIADSGFGLIFKIITYIWFLQAVTALVMGEFANVVSGLIVQLLSLLVILGLLKIFSRTICITGN